MHTCQHGYMATWVHSYIYMMHTCLLAKLLNIHSMSTFTFSTLSPPSHYLNTALHHVVFLWALLHTPHMLKLWYFAHTQHVHAAHLPHCKSTEYACMISFNCMHVCSICMHSHMHAHACTPTCTWPSSIPHPYTSQDCHTHVCHSSHCIHTFHTCACGGGT